MRLRKSYAQSHFRAIHACDVCMLELFWSSYANSDFYPSSRFYCSAVTKSKLLRGSGVECMGGAGMTSRPPSPMATRPIATRYVRGLTSTTPPIYRTSRTIVHHSLSYHSLLCQAAPNHIISTSCACTSTAKKAVNTSRPDAQLDRKGRCFVARPYPFLTRANEYAEDSDRFLAVVLTTGN
jgi:hypothetical protein